MIHILLPIVLMTYLSIHAMEEKKPEDQEKQLRMVRVPDSSTLSNLTVLTIGGSKESPLQEMPDLSSLSVASAPQLMTLNIEHVLADTFPTDALRSILSQLAVLAVRHCNLKSFALPKGIRGELDTLDLSHNCLADLTCPSEILGDFLVKKIDVSHNGWSKKYPMYVIGENARRNVLGAVEEVNISHNGITTLEPGAFRAFINLKRLDASHNCITECAPQMCLFLGKLEELNLSDNKMTSFSCLSKNKLRILLLRNNQLTHFDLWPDESLEQLDMTHNKFEKFPTRTDRRKRNAIFAANLQSLKLGDNPLLEGQPNRALLPKQCKISTVAEDNK